jgi:outer membrane protein assembly factor BamB
MPRDLPTLVFVGIKNSVVALDDHSGLEIWRTQLRGSDYVTVLWDGSALFAANSGEVWRLNPLTGELIWHNGLKGLGRGLVTIASTRVAGAASDTLTAAAKRRRDQESASAAAVVAAG